MNPASIRTQPQHREKLLDLTTEETINTAASLLNFSELGNPLPAEPAADGTSEEHRVIAEESSQPAQE
jgi:hypothetical protein